MSSGNLDGFDANKFEPNVGFTPIPAGDYKCMIISSKKEDNKKKTGWFLTLQFQIVEGPHAGHKGLFDRLNLVNPSATAVQIAQGTLSAICRAVGKMTPKDSTELHNIPLIVSVNVEKRADNGQLGNVLKGYKKVEGGVGTASQNFAPPGGTSAVPAGAPSDTPPWLRK